MGCSQNKFRKKGSFFANREHVNQSTGRLFLQIRHRAKRRGRGTYCGRIWVLLSAQRSHRFKSARALTETGTAQCNTTGHYNYKTSQTAQYVKVKMSHYRHEKTLTAPGDWGSQNFWTTGTWRLAKLSALYTSHFYPQEVSPVLISVRSWVDPKVIVRPQG